MNNNTEKTMKVAMSLSEVCNATTLCRTRIYQEIDAKRLRVVHSGRRVLVPVESLNAFMKLLGEEEGVF